MILFPVFLPFSFALIFNFMDPCSMLFQTSFLHLFSSFPFLLGNLVCNEGAYWARGPISLQRGCLWVVLINHFFHLFLHIYCWKCIFVGFAVLLLQERRERKARTIVSPIPFNGVHDKGILLLSHSSKMSSLGPDIFYFYLILQHVVLHFPCIFM